MCEVLFVQKIVKALIALKKGRVEMCSAFINLYVTVIGVLVQL